MPGLHVRKGDTVQVISGKDRGLKGKVLVAFPTRNRVLVEGANRVTTTQRGAQSGGIVTQEAPLHVSNVQVVCPSCGKPSRRCPSRDGLPQDGQTTWTLLTCSGASWVTMPPDCAPRWVVVTRLAPSTSTRLRVGKATSTLPFRPRSLPLITCTVSPLRTWSPGMV